MPAKITRPFSGIQFYMANTGMSVHALLEGVAPMQREDVEQVIARVLDQAPQLGWEERVAEGGYRVPDTPPSPAALLIEPPAGTEAERGDALTRALRAPLADRGKASFQVIWQPAGPSDPAQPGRLTFHTTHGILEGGDVSGILRGRASDRAQRGEQDLALPWVQRVLASALVPVLWVIHMLIARFATGGSERFRYQRMVIDRASLKGAAEGLGISQRALLFALASQTFRQHAKPGKTVSVIYSTLPTRRARLVDDEYLNVRVDEIRLRAVADFAAYARHVDQVLAKRGPNPLFLATCQRKLLRMHRWVHARAPWIFPRRFFGFSPQDLILSMIPPVDAARFDPHFAQATLFAGSNTGTANNCIFVPSARSVGLTFWTDIDPQGLLQTMQALGAPLGIAVSPALSDPPADSHADSHGAP